MGDDDFELCIADRRQRAEILGWGATVTEQMARFDGPRRVGLYL